MTVEQVLGDPVIYLALGIVLGLIAAVGALLLRRPPPPPPPPQTSQQGQEKREQEREQGIVWIDEAVGLDRALAHRFYIELRRAMREGRVRVTLTAEGCKGRVAYDFAREAWICVEEDGTSYPLGGRPAPEVVEYYDEG